MSLESDILRTLSGFGIFTEHQAATAKTIQRLGGFENLKVLRQTLKKMADRRTISRAGTRDIKYWVQCCPKEAVDYVLEDAYQKRAHYDKLISSLETTYPDAA